MIHYLAVVGSEGYGLAIEESDQDILCVSDEGYKSNLHQGIHTIAYDTDDFLNRFCPLPSANLPYYIQWLFPSEIIKETKFSKIAIESREKIVQSDLKRIYQEYLDKADNLSYRLRECYKTFAKRGAYACMFYNTIYQYANGATFAEASKPSGEFRQWLLAVRNREIPVEELVEGNRILREKAISVSGFYDRDEDKKTLIEMQTLFLEATIL